MLLEEAGAIPASPGMVHTPRQMLMQESGTMPRFADGGSVPNINFEARGIPNMTGTPGIGYEQGVQGTIARMQLEQELRNRARLRAGVSGMGMALPGQHGVKMMPGQVDIGYKMPLGQGNLDISARRDINKQRPGMPQNYAANINYNLEFADGGAVQMSPQDMLAELIYGGRVPQHFASGGGTLKNIAGQAAFELPFMAEDAKLIAKDLKAQKYPEAAARTASVGYSAFTPWNPLTALISGLTYSPEVGDATLDAYLAQKQAEAAPKPQPKQKRPAERHNIIPFTETRFYKN